MQVNSFPEKLILKTIKRTLLSNSKSKKTFYTIRSAWYEKGIAKQLKPVPNRYGSEMIFAASLPLKSKLPTNPFKSCSACEVVYKVTCSCYKKYIGKTGRTIRERIKEHQRYINNEGLSQHFRESAHTPN